MDSIQKVNKVCKDILKLSEVDIEEAEKMAQEQIEYIHPLKYAKASKFHKMGNNNKKILTALKNLRTLIIDSKP